MVKYRKMPVEVEAKQLSRQSADEVCSWIVQNGGIVSGGGYGVSGVYLIIETLEGQHLANEGDYIIQGVNGEFYPCKPDIFEKTYEKADDGEYECEGWIDAFWSVDGKLKVSGEGITPRVYHSKEEALDVRERLGQGEIPYIAEPVKVRWNKQ